MQALYQMDIGGAGINDIFAEFESHWLGNEVEGDTYLPAEAAFFRDVVSGVVRDQKKLDPLIDEALSKGWPLKRIEAILRAVLRAGAYELEHRKDVPGRVVVSEYVDVAQCLRRPRGDRHGQRGARPDRPPVPRRRVWAGVVNEGGEEMRCGCPIFRCHHPRRRVIQYAAAVVIHHWRLGILDRPVKPGDDSVGVADADGRLAKSLRRRLPHRALFQAAGD